MRVSLLLYEISFDLFCRTLFKRLFSYIQCRDPFVCWLVFVEGINNFLQFFRSPGSIHMFLIYKILIWIYVSSEMVAVACYDYF